MKINTQILRAKKNKPIAHFFHLPLQQPPFDQLEKFSALLQDENWPTLQALNQWLGDVLHPITGKKMHFVQQDQQLLRDGCHFEQRIFERGEIATRSSSWHDLFSAFMWMQFPLCKLALNTLHVEDIGKATNGNRTRRQQSLTHIDEAGLFVASSDMNLLKAICEHDWQHIFWQQRQAWGQSINVWVFGHALFELMQNPYVTLAGKATLVYTSAAFFKLNDMQQIKLLDQHIAQALKQEQWGADPKDLPSLPLSGIPGWHPQNGHLEFIQQAECFRAKPAGRVYAQPLSLIV